MEKITFQEVVRRAIQAHTKVDVYEIYEKRKQYITDARDIYCQILRESHFIYREIATPIHTDIPRVHLAHKKINNILSYDKNFRTLYIKILTTISNEISKREMLEYGKTISQLINNQINKK